MKHILLMAALIAPIAAVPGGQARALHTRGYTVSRTAAGERLTLHFARRSYPRRALISVTARLTNLSRRGLHVDPPRPAAMHGECGGLAFVYAARPNGANAEPPAAAYYPFPGCGVDFPVPLPVGRSLVEREWVVLWTGRIYTEAGDIKDGPMARLRLYNARAPVISVNATTGTATVHRPPGAEGKMYYRSYGVCGASGWGILAWTAARRPAVVAPCAPISQWHIDVAWRDTPVARASLDASR